jgi:hypothetical protein
MDKYIPIEKRGKKEKLALAKARRKTWGALNPVTRKPANPQAYNRRKSRHEEAFFDGGVCFFCRRATSPELSTGKSGPLK